MNRNGKSFNLVPSSTLSLIGGSLIIVGGLVHLGMLGMSGHYGMMSGLIPHVQVKIIPNAAHLPNMDQPKLVNTMILKFLAK